MNIKTAVVPFSHFEDIKRDFTEFLKRDDLNGFQKWIAAERYMLKPRLDFVPRSVIVAATPLIVKEAEFTYLGKQYKSLLTLSESSEEVVKYLSGGGNYHFFYDYWLPAKWTAVRAGLCEYGRNNICYAGDYGSLITLFVYISDMPCPENYVWREVKDMDICEGCNLCETSCPTLAMKPKRFLLENTMCLTAYNEDGGPAFPDFIPETIHHSIVCCYRCQEICPMNRGKFENIVETVPFTEEETALLLAGTKFDEMPAPLNAKVERCSMKWFYHALPRNLKALIRAADLR